MCAALGLLETHLGIKTAEAAKASAAERFIALHYKLLAYQVPPFTNTQQQPAETGALGQGQEFGNGAKVRSGIPSIGLKQFELRVQQQSITPFPQDAGGIPLEGTPFTRDGLPMSMPWLLPSGAADPSQAMMANPDFNLELLGMDLNELWGGDWNGADFT